MSKEYKKVKLKNGETRYIFDVSLGTVNGRRKRTTIRAKTVKEGRKKKSELLLSNQLVIANGSMLFDDAYQLYLNAVKPKLSPTTYDQKIYAMVHFDCFSNQPIARITRRDVQFWYNNLQLRSNSKRNTYAKLSSFFNWCVNNDVLQANPCNGVELGRKSHKEMAFLTEAEFWQLYRAIDNETFRQADTYRMAVLVLMFCGLRKGELCGLSSADLVGNELHLHHTLKTIKDNGLIISDEFKNKYSRRVVPVPIWLVYDLQSFLQSDLYPFKPIYRSLRRCLEIVLKRENMKHIRVHDLRHSYASMLIARGVDIFTVSRLMGHSSVTVTSAVYGHLYKETRQSISEML